MVDSVVNWAVLVFLGAVAYHRFIGQHLRRRRSRRWSGPQTRFAAADTTTKEAPTTIPALSA